MPGADMPPWPLFCLMSLEERGRIIRKIQKEVDGEDPDDEDYLAADEDDDEDWDDE